MVKKKKSKIRLEKCFVLERVRHVQEEVQMEAADGLGYDFQFHLDTIIAGDVIRFALMVLRRSTAISIAKNATTYDPATTF